jgi:hypothetical protein
MAQTLKDRLSAGRGGLLVLLISCGPSFSVQKPLFRFPPRMAGACPATFLTLPWRHSESGPGDRTRVDVQLDDQQNERDQGHASHSER